VDVQSDELRFVSPELRNGREAVAGVLGLGLAGVGVFPESKEFPVMIRGLGRFPLLFADFSEPVVGLGIDIAVIEPAET